MFLVLEGPDGVGKTAQADRLAARLEARGLTVVRLREPTDGPWGRRIREAARANTRPDAETEVEWFTRDREQDVRENIAPAMAAGETIVLDRYFYSTAAYQSVRGVAVADILVRNRAFAPEPDLCVVLTCPVQVARERIVASRGDTPDAFEALDAQRAIAAVFADLVATHEHLIAIEDGLLGGIDGVAPLSVG